MRLNGLEVPPGLSKMFSQEVSLDIFRKICLCRNFELNVKKAYDAKLITPPIYLSLGQESITAALSVVLPDAYKLGQHRCHDIYICWGGKLEALRDELLGLPTGCAGGMGGSASIHCPEIKMIGHDGHMGTQVPIAGGFAQGTGEICIAIMGDASAEEGYVLGDMGKSASRKDPVLYVCYDNNLSIKTEVEVRRSWKMVDIARAFGMPAADIVDDPWLVMHYTERMKKNLPAFLNIHTCRELWHAGTGCDGTPEWNRYEMVKTELILLGLKSEIQHIENSASGRMDNLWEDVLYPKKESI